MTDADIPGFVKVFQESSTTSIFNFSDNVALGHSGRSVSSLCSGFLEVPLQHQHVSGEKVQFDEYTAGPTKAPVKKSQELCSKKDHNNKVQRCTCSNGENMGSAWLHNKFVSPPIAMAPKSFRRSKAFFAIHLQGCQRAR